MKFLIASDIHGSSHFCRLLINAISKEKPDRIILLGDILYHGPRNDLPKAYSPKEVINMLNFFKGKLLCVRGNCDSEVDQMVLDFPCMADYAVIPVENRLIYATHGHLFGEDNPPPLCKGDFLLCGHTHIPKCSDNGKFVYMNTGSVSLPKENTPHSYMVLNDGEFVWKNLETGEIFNKFSV